MKKEKKIVYEAMHYDYIFFVFVQKVNHINHNL